MHQIAVIKAKIIYVLTNFFNIVFTGNIGEAQGIDLAIEVANILKNEKICWHFVGEGRNRKKLEKMVKEYNIDERVIFHGFHPEKEIPKYLKEALVSIEDERFYEHQGVDIISLTRSVLHNIFSDTIQGGSTIEMQISKNLLTSEDKTITRKIKDMYYATQMDKFMTKDEILCTYLNNVYFGKSAYGVGKASKVYFGKDVQDLTLAQSAMLVGITNSPAKYKEHREAKKRQEVILYKMKELGYIDEDEYIQAINEDVPFKSEIE